MQSLGDLSMTNHTRRKTILVVEDDADIGAFTVQALTQETPHHPLLVADDKQALEVTRKLIPDLFIIDRKRPSSRSNLCRYSELSVFKVRECC
jgi:DNA-binding response OmpR family regulator